MEKSSILYLLVSCDVVAVAILKLRPTMLPFGAYITNQSTFGGVSQSNAQSDLSLRLARYQLVYYIKSYIFRSCILKATFFIVQVLLSS